MKKIFYVILLLSFNVIATHRYCAPTGNDDNDGTTLEQAVLTIQKGFDVSVGIDTLFICYDTFVNTKTDTLGVKRGGTLPATLISPFRVVACSTNGSIRTNTYTTITASTALADGLWYFTDSSDYTYVQWFDFDANNNAKYSIRTENSTKVIACMFGNCKFHKAKDYGVLLRVVSTTTSNWSFEQCAFYDNIGSGIGWTTAKASYIKLRYCSSYNNGGNGFVVSHGTVIGCLAYKNGLSGFYFDSDVGDYFINKCVSSYNGNSGMLFYASVSGKYVIKNCILSNNTNYAINSSNGSFNRFLESSNNCSYLNAHHFDGVIDTLPGLNNIYADPLFVNTTDNNEDFRLQTGSPCLHVAQKNIFIRR